MTSFCTGWGRVEIYNENCKAALAAVEEAFPEPLETVARVCDGGMQGTCDGFTLARTINHHTMYEATSNRGGVQLHSFNDDCDDDEEETYRLLNVLAPFAQPGGYFCTEGGMCGTLWFTFDGDHGDG